MRRYYVSSMSLRSPEINEEFSMPGSAFATTHWSVVLTAGKADSPRAAEALERLCSTYWYPLYAFVRRRGYSEPDARDLTQAFFAHLLERDALQCVSAERGKFRSFLLASLNYFLADARDRALAQKRGGGREIVSFDAQEAEDRYRLEPIDPQSPARIFERRWALTLLEQSLAQVRQEYSTPKRTELFEALKVFLVGGTHLPTYNEIASSLGLREDTVKMTVHRLRKQYREILRQEVAHTVSSPAEIDEELRYLFAVLSDAA